MEIGIAINATSPPYNCVIIYIGIDYNRSAAAHFFHKAIE
jgi:hypothetical protein